MHRSSESVAAIATALAKAQTELSNPEKAMVGRSTTTGQIVRKASATPLYQAAWISSERPWVGQQIAIAQTTDIDRANGTVNLITVLLHTSGEWISSDWPVCQLSETSAPRRMGAALTYARRYALFTMVGIAGEDDLDAPPDVTADLAAGRKAADTAPSSNPSLTPAWVRPSPPRTESSITPPVRERLCVGESAAIRVELIREIETLSEADLPARAIAILKAKNRLAADDAKLVEEAFSARMGLPSAQPEVFDGGRACARPNRTGTAKARSINRRPEATEGTPQKNSSSGRAIC